MATLGDKQYNYSFYGLPDRGRVWGTPGAGGYAALTALNMWGLYMGPPISEFFTNGIYWEHDGTTSDTYGKPLDETVSLWKINKNSSFACNACFSVETGDTLKPHYDVNVHNTDAPFAMCATDTHGGAYGNFVRDPVNRWAYDVSLECNGSYSAPIFDIVYNNFCLYAGALCYNSANNTISGQTLAQIATYIDTAPETRDVCVIRPYLYRGASTPRYRTADGIPPQGAGTTYDGTPLIDTLTNRPIPQSESYLRDLIKDGHDERRDDVVYSPFAMQLGVLLYSTTTSPQRYDVTSQLEIGLNRQLTVSNLRNGAIVISGANRITAQYYRCNYDVKTFSDVAYQWENVAYDVTNGIELQPGFPLTSLSNSSNIRFYTRLRIIDAKGNSKGKACELAIKHEMAFIGMYFCDTMARAESAELGTAAEGVYLPLYTGGVPNGEYVTGDAIPLQPHANAGSVADDTFKYKPEMTGSDSGDLNTHLHSDTVYEGAQWFAMGSADVYFLSQWLNVTYKPDPTQLAEDFKGVNPADYIIGVKYYPFDIPEGATKELTIGGISVTVNGATINPSTHIREYGPGSNSYFDLGSFTMAPPYIYGDFRDTLMRLLLYIPWCGFVTLDPALFCQSPDGTYHTIRAALSVDYATGTALGLVYRDNSLLETINGTVGIDIPLSSIAAGTYQNAIKQTEIALKNAKSQQMAAVLSMGAAVIGGIASAATGNVAGVGIAAASFAGGAIKTDQSINNIENVKYQLSHTAPNTADISSASPFNGALSEQAARIFIFRAAMLPEYDETAYGKTTGFACCKQGKLSSISNGFTQCASADLSGIPCTATEKNMILSALQSGVII